MTAPSAQAQSSQTRPSEVVLRTQNLSKSYGSRLAVDNLNLDVRRGEIFGFLGPNGAGKTTTIRMALGLIAPTGGSVEVLGQDIGAASARRCCHRWARWSRRPRSTPTCRGATTCARWRARSAAFPIRTLTPSWMSSGCADRQKDRVRTYSLGMKQRLGVAMALLHNPDLLILDEPANGLDPAGIVEMRDLMRALAAQGKTVFISSHVLTEVQQICTRVAIINYGRLVTESTVEALTQTQGGLCRQGARASRGAGAGQGAALGRLRADRRQRLPADSLT